jgi:acyl-CoA thioester hydrolase
VTREVPVEVRVRYAETDRMGVAYYANFLVWFEVGRSEYMRAVGCPYRRLEEEDLRMPVTEASCRFLSPAHYDDLLEVWTTVDEVGPVRVRFRYRVVRRDDGRLLAEGATRHAAVAGTGRPRRIPDEVRRCLIG